MRRGAFAGGIVVLAMLGAPTPARACGQGSSYYGGAIVAIGIGAIAVASADIAMTILDGSSMAQKRHRSIGYGVLEGLVAGPQFALGLYGLTHSGNVGTGYIAVYTVWMGLLTTHGIWTIVTAPRATSVPSDAVEPQPPSPAPPSDVTASPPPAEPLPYFQMSLGPTYVPLGQRGQPGFGIVGRF
jgi:hypothetical protein